MPQQLIYTSAPQGVDAGRSGYCTVARSSTMGESLIHRLEQLSYYERLSEHGGATERTVFDFRNLDIRGKTFHVLSRIKDAPADYTGRTNFIAHHLVFTPEEVAELPVPAVIFRRWPHWKDEWREEPRLLENEPWPEREELKDRTFLPALNWFRETGDHARASGLLGFNSGVFVAHQFRPETILDLLAEALDLLQLEGPNWRSLAWQRTFSVGCQPQDNPADFRWRFLTSYLPFESAVTQGRAPEELGKLRPAANSRQVEFCKKGPADPQFTRLPRAGTAVRITEGEPLVLDCEAQSLPGEIIYRWYAVGKDNATEEEVDGAYTGKLELPSIGRGKWRYKVRAWDSITNKCAESPLIVVEVDEKRRGAAWTPPPSSAAAAPVRQNSKEPNYPVSLPKRKPPSPTDKCDLSDNSGGDNRKQSCKPIVIASFLFLILVSGLFLLFTGFFKPHFRDRTVWWNLKIVKQPEAFESHPDISEDTRVNIQNYKEALGTITNGPTGKNKSKTFKKPDTEEMAKRRKALLDNIEDELAAHQSEAPSKSSTLAPTKPDRGKSPQETGGQPKTPSVKPKSTHAPKAQGHLYVILAREDWDKSIKQLEEAFAQQQLLQITATTTLKNAETLNNNNQEKDPIKISQALTAVNKATSELARITKNIQVQTNLLTKRHNQINKGNQIQYPKSWSDLDKTNGTPLLNLEWALLGEEFSERNRVIGEWQTTNWLFRTANWSLQVSKTNAVYHTTQQSGALRVDITIDDPEKTVGDCLRLLLFTENTNKVFQATLEGDNLKPSGNLMEFLERLVLQTNNPLRLIANYPNIARPMINTLNDIQAMGIKDGKWKLGIADQLTPDKLRAGRLEKVEMGLKKVESLWSLVAKEHQTQLREDSFSEAIGGDKRAIANSEQEFWKQLNLLFAVAIYQRADRRIDFLDETDESSLRKKLELTLVEQGPTARKFQSQIEQLVGNLDDFRVFWKSDARKYKLKSYTEAKDLLSEEIRMLRKRGGEIVPKELVVELQIEALQGKWVTVTRLDCRP